MENFYGILYMMVMPLLGYAFFQTKHVKNKSATSFYYAFVRNFFMFMFLVISTPLYYFLELKDKSVNELFFTYFVFLVVFSVLDFLQIRHSRKIFKLDEEEVEEVEEEEEVKLNQTASNEIDYQEIIENRKEEK